MLRRVSSCPLLPVRLEQKEVRAQGRGEMACGLKKGDGDCGDGDEYPAIE